MYKRQRHIKEIETVQKRATKLIIKFKKPYRKSVSHLNLPTLKYRRLRGEFIEVFKITHNTYDEAVSPDLSFYAGLVLETITINWLIILFIMTYASIRIVNIWNSLPNSIVDAVNAFKAQLDKFWLHQAVKYDFTADLTGTGNRVRHIDADVRGVSTYVRNVLLS